MTHKTGERVKKAHSTCSNEREQTFQKKNNIMAFNIARWARNYENTMHLRIKFDVVAWAQNYLRTLPLRMTLKELAESREEDEKLLKEARDKQWQFIRRQQTMNRRQMIKQQQQEKEALALRKLEHIRRPFYASAPMGGSFNVEEIEGDRKWLSPKPQQAWLEMFGRKARNHIPILCRVGAEPFLMMKETDDGYFSD